MRGLAALYALPWDKVLDMERLWLAQSVTAVSKIASGIDVVEENAKDKKFNLKRAMKIGGATVFGGAALALTGGIAAPAVAAVFGAVGSVIGVGTALAAMGGTAAVSIMFGAAGAGLAGYKTARRTGDVQDFAFQPIGRRVVLEVTEAGPLGLTFPTGRVPLVVAEILDGSLASKQSRLAPGMRLLEVNETPVTGLSYTQALALIHLNKRLVEDGRTMRLTFVPATPLAIRPPGDPDDSEVDEVPARDLSTTELEAAESADRTGMAVTIGVSGWLMGEEDTVESHWHFVRDQAPPTALQTAEAYALAWELEELVELGSAFYDFLKERAVLIAADGVATAMVGSVIATLALPVALVGATHLIANPWIIVHHRAKKAGQLLANVLLERQHGHRPVTLLGFSTGARVVLTCLEALAEAGPDAVGLVESAFLVGGAISADPVRWSRCRPIVSHRLVNGFKEDDLVLALLFRANSLKAGSVAGLEPVDVAGVENLDLSEICPGKTGHGFYRERAAEIFAAMGAGANSSDVFIVDGTTEGAVISPLGATEEDGLFEPGPKRDPEPDSAPEPEPDSAALQGDEVANAARLRRLEKLGGGGRLAGGSVRRAKFSSEV